MSRRRTANQRRPHDAAASRADLLQAAQELFAQRGYIGTTLRDIGERAQVDASMVARYFGNKEALYLAVLSSEPPPELVEPAPRATASVLLTRWDERGPGPAVQSLIRPEVGDDIRAQMRERLEERLINPLSERFTEQGADQPRLRAQMVIATLVGIGVVRSVGTFQELADAPLQTVLEILGPALDGLAKT